MADIHLSSPGGKRRNKIIPRIDLTPMVDLGFLLITFFMYTTTMGKPKVIDLNMPVPGKPSEIPEESTITLIPAAGHQVFYYEGILKVQRLKQTDINNIRQVIQQEQQRVQALSVSYSREAHLLHVVIKPHENSVYNDLITILDEMTINNIAYYAIADITEEESSLLTKE